MGSRIIGTGRGIPASALTNQDLERQLDTSDEWIRSRTGIASRYLMRTGEGLLDIAVQASRRALDKAGMKAGELDAIVAGTVSSEYAFPSFACQVQRELGVTSIPAFDVAAACSGFLFALSVADYSMRAGAWRKVLVIGADALSTMVNWGDRRTAVLFGDGAGAAVMVYEPGSQGCAGDAAPIGRRGVGAAVVACHRNPRQRRFRIAPRPGRYAQDARSRTVQNRGQKYGGYHPPGGRARRRNFGGCQTGRASSGQ